MGPNPHLISVLISYMGKESVKIPIGFVCQWTGREGGGIILLLLFFSQILARELSTIPERNLK